MSKLFRPRTLLLVIVMLIMAAAAYGFAAGINADDSYAGEGNGNVLDMTVTNIHYDLNTTNPTLIDTVQFDLGPAAAFSLIYFLIILLFSFAFYQALLNVGRGDKV